MPIARIVLWGAGPVLVVALSGWGRSPALRTHDVRMVANRFEPGETRARAGDTLRFINVGGGPHNIQFFADSMPDSARRLLEQAMPAEKIGPLSSPLLLDRNEVYAIVLPALAPGRYPFVCLPHFASRMSGALVVVP